MDLVLLARWLAKKFRRSVLGERLAAPRRWISSPEYAERSGARWFTIHPRASNDRVPPIRHGAQEADLQRRLDREFPEMGVLELRDATVLGKDGWVFSREGDLLPDHSWYVGHVDEMRVRRRLPAGDRLEGVSLSLATDFSMGSYGHFLLDGISRMDLFAKAGFDLARVDHVICAKPPSASARRHLDRLGISPDKFVWLEDIRALNVATLIVASFPGTRRNYATWVPESLRRTFLPSPPPLPPTRRLYISRKGRRRNVVNEEAIHRMLENHGFEVYDPSQHSDTPRDFAEAAIVIGPHGGGLTDLAFCQPGTKVLELIPTDHVHPYFYTLSESGGLEYGYLLGRSTHEREPEAFGPSLSDFHIDEAEFARALDRITSGTRTG